MATKEIKSAIRTVVGYHNLAAGQNRLVTEDDPLPVTGALETEELTTAIGDLETAVGSLEVAVDENTAALASGLPKYDVLAAGADAYALVVESPARVCHNIRYSLDDGNDAIVSLDEGTSDHFHIVAGTGETITGLLIPAETEIHAKNVSAGNNFTNLRISVW